MSSISCQTTNPGTSFRESVALEGASRAYSGDFQTGFWSFAGREAGGALIGVAAGLAGSSKAGLEITSA